MDILLIILILAALAALLFGGLIVLLYFAAQAELQDEQARVSSLLAEGCYDRMICPDSPDQACHNRQARRRMRPHLAGRGDCRARHRWFGISPAVPWLVAQAEPPGSLILILAV